MSDEARDSNRGAATNRVLRRRDLRHGGRQPGARRRRYGPSGFCFYLPAYLLAALAPDSDLVLPFIVYSPELYDAVTEPDKAASWAFQGAAQCAWILENGMRVDMPTVITLVRVAVLDNRG